MIKRKGVWAVILGAITLVVILGFNGSNFKFLLPLDPATSETKELTTDVSTPHRTRVQHVYPDHTVIQHLTKQGGSLNNYKHTILFNVVIGSGTAYGVDRKFSDLLETLLTLWKDNPQYKITLGLLVSPKSEFDAVDKIFSSVDVPGVHEITLISAPFMESDKVAKAEDRHSDALQRLRRRTLGRVRNFLMYSTLKEQEYVFFMDADVVRFDRPDQFIAALINSKAPIVVPRITNGPNIDYDLNTWRGERTKPTKEQLALLDAGKWLAFDYVPRDVSGKMKHLRDFADYLNPNADISKLELVDSVGGAVLFAKSIVLKQGVMFPPIYIVGTTWDRLEGYDGIETEGMCYIAKPLGYSCYAMPNLVAHHKNRG